MKIFESKDSRILYNTWGYPTHRPLLFFHGFPGSHLQASALEPFLIKHKLFLVAADRPGYGGSFSSGSKFDYLDLMRELLNKMDIQKFDVLGVSGGAPWAHLMASRFAEDVRSLQVVCGLSTYNRETNPFFSAFQNRSLKALRILPFRTIELFFNLALNNFDSEKNIDLFLNRLDPSDGQVLSEPENRTLLLNSMKHAKSQGAKGIARDTALYHRDWLRKDCDLKRLNAIPKFYFHGVRDKILDHRMSEWMHKSTLNSELTFFEEEGHYSLPFRQADQILEGISRL